MELLEPARAWMAADPDDRMRDQLTRLIDRAEGGDVEALDELADAFDGTLEFGTAGLRGRVGPGPNRMNVVVVARAAAGLARYVLAHGGGAVVVGHDARHDSDLFARTTAQILTGAGLSVMMLPGRLPTPVLAFAIRSLGCAAGVMVTASHNPAEDNGYKVYLGDGVQIVPPADAEIARHIADVAALGPVADLPHGGEWDTLGDEIVARYVAKVASTLEAGPPLHVKLAYTAMHGVAGSTFLRVLEESGFPEPVIVEEQFSPDPDFPTVPFPNPEEPGAMDLALATAAEHECDVLIAHDPDGDRCAVGVPGPDGWRMLSGDEVGWLLGWWIAAGNRRLTRHCVFAESIVSGTMLKAIAEDAGIDYAQTLTGFKWIARVPDLTYGYEEALGYCVDPTGVSDKDGISAGLMVAEMVARLKQWNTDVLHVLDDLAQQYGVHATRPISLRVDDLTRIDAIMSAVRADPPAAIAGIRVAEMVDLIDGTDELPATDALVFHLESGARVVIRPSGTEPKIKCYLQSVVKDEVDDLPAARAVAEAELDAIGAEVTRWLQ